MSPAPAAKAQQGHPYEASAAWAFACRPTGHLAGSGSRPRLQHPQKQDGSQFRARRPGLRSTTRRAGVAQSVVVHRRHGQVPRRGISCRQPGRESHGASVARGATILVDDCAGDCHAVPGRPHARSGLLRRKLPCRGTTAATLRFRGLLSGRRIRRATPYGAVVTTVARPVLRRDRFTGTRTDVVRTV
jgi:hypothetical protein